MKITGIETVQLPEHPNLVFIRVETDDGLIGLGETFFAGDTVAAYIHEAAAPTLLGAEALHIEAHARALQTYLGHDGAGAETRGNSAVDLALWDLFGKAVGKPVYQLLGGPMRDQVRVYNTCAGYRYVRDRAKQSVDNWGLPDGEPTGPYEDLHATFHHPDELARSLLAEGITGMKIWPFDRFAEQSGGHDITASELREALEPFRKIREAVGDSIDIMVELHGLWDLPAAKRIAGALEPYAPRWLEDPVRADHREGLAELASSTSVPVAASEMLAGRRAYRDLLDRAACDIVIFDVGWVGGITEAKAVASMAEAYNRPVAPHDCTGPVVLTAASHLSAHLPNALVQEFVRASYSTWYRELVTTLPHIADGMMAPPVGPGLGTELLPDVLERPDIVRRRTTL